jgi:hypothetical protein
MKEVPTGVKIIAVLEYIGAGILVLLKVLRKFVNMKFLICLR